MLEATHFDGSWLQNLGSWLPEKSDIRSHNTEKLTGTMMDHRRQVATLLLDQRREEDLFICRSMDQEQLFMLRAWMQIILIGMMNSLDLIITPVETVKWSLEDHTNLLTDIKYWQQTYKIYLKELIDTKEIHNHREFEIWSRKNPANYETWSIKPGDKDIIGERSFDYITTYWKSFADLWDKIRIREIKSLLSGLTPAGQDYNDSCVISKIAISQLGSKYQQ